MCTDLGQHEEPGVSDLGHRGQSEEAVPHWDSYQDLWSTDEIKLQVIWHKRMAFKCTQNSSYLAQEDGIQEALKTRCLAQEDVAGHIWKLIVKQV